MTFVASPSDAFLGFRRRLERHRRGKKALRRASMDWPSPLKGSKLAKNAHVNARRKLRSASEAHLNASMGPASASMGPADTSMGLEETPLVLAHGSEGLKSLPGFA
jgi:hypothetical protein